MILALDPSTVCIGWALMDAEHVYEHGVFRPKDLADIGYWAFDLMSSTMETSNIEVVALEMPVLHSSHQNVMTVIRLAQVTGVLISVAQRLDVRSIVEVQPHERLTALGLPLRMKRAAAKEAVAAVVRGRYGIELAAGDEADAIAVGLAALRKMGQ